MKTMKATLIYFDFDKMQAEEGTKKYCMPFQDKVYTKRPDLYFVVDTAECRVDELPEHVAESFFNDYNIDDGKQAEKGVRSMSVGDVVVFESRGQTTAIVVAGIGFERVDVPDKWFKEVCSNAR
jgi:hypothetical protein